MSLITRSGKGSKLSIDEMDNNLLYLENINKPLVTLDTGSEVFLYQQGNFCNSEDVNYNTSFTFSFGDNDNIAGSNATVLIKATLSFPTVDGAEYVDGAQFESDGFYDMYLWNNSHTTAYTFLKRSAPISKATFITDSKSSSWKPSIITNSSDILIWNVTGDIVIKDFASNTPSFDFSSNTGELIVTVSDSKNLVDITITANILEIDVSKCDNLEVLRLSSNNDLRSLDISNLSKLTTIRTHGCNLLPGFSVSNNPLLNYIVINDNMVTSIDVSNNILLDRFEIDRTSITSLDLSNNNLLTKVKFSSSLLTPEAVDQVFADLNNNLFSGSISSRPSTDAALDDISQIRARGGTVYI